MSAKTGTLEQAQVQQQQLSSKHAAQAMHELEHPRLNNSRTYRHDQLLEQHGQRYLEANLSINWLDAPELLSEKLTEQAIRKSVEERKRLHHIERNQLGVLDSHLASHPNRDAILAVMEDSHVPEWELGGMPMESTRIHTDHDRTAKEPALSEPQSYLGYPAEQAVLYMVRFNQAWRGGFDGYKFHEHQQRTSKKRATHNIEQLVLRSRGRKRKQLKAGRPKGSTVVRGRVDDDGIPVL